MPESVFSRFDDALRQEGIEERRQQREAAKLEPITIVIADQEELRRIYELAARRKDRPVPMVRRHLRGWSRDMLDGVRIEQRID